MAKWETCEIRYHTLQESETKYSFFGIRKEIPSVSRYEARNLGVTGAQGLIYKSEDISIGGNLKHGHLEYEGKYAREEYLKMIAYLTSEGWEPTATDTSGEISHMRRQIIESAPGLSTDTVSLLQQLTNLKNAGILTEQEFQVKKSEILKRM